MIDNDSEFDIEFIDTLQVVSKCCGTPCRGSMYETKYGNLVGKCSGCGEYTVFAPDIPNESKN